MSRTEWRFRRAMLGLVLYRASHVLPPVRIVEIGRVLKPGRSPITGVPGLFTVVKPPGQASSAEQHAWITRYRPQIVEGFPTALDVLVEECRKNGWRLPKPRLVVCRGEVLFPDVRRSLEEGFGAPVVDHYNCEEIGNVAWQCPADPDVMHINTAACVVEVVDAQGVPLEPNETGFIALTNLYNHTMPFIRYLVGDRGRLLEPDGSPCRCGFRGLSMALVDGRSDDIVRLPTGQRLSPRVVATVMFRRPDGSRIAGIRKYQLIQSALDRAKLRVVLEEKRDADWHEVLLANGRTLLAGIDLEIEEVPEIPFEHSGKYRRIVRRLS